MHAQQCKLHIQITNIRKKLNERDLEQSNFKFLSNVIKAKDIALQA